MGYRIWGVKGMRTKNNLFALGEIVILYQYLYMSEENRITIDNGLAKIDIRMDEGGEFWGLNHNFRDLPEGRWSEILTIPALLGIIKQLKSIPPVEFTNSFGSRWDEIKNITLTNKVLNRR